MRIILGMGSLYLAASLAGPAAFAQGTGHAARSASMVDAVAPYLGVGGQDVTDDRAKALKLKDERGVEVTSVQPDSAAAKAGLKAGDVVLEFNGQKVEGWEHLKRLVHETPIHREVKISVWRNGAAQSLTATVGSQRQMQIDMGNGMMVLPNMSLPPMPPSAPMAPMPPMDLPQFRTFIATSTLGIMGESLGQESQLAEFFGVKEGILVRSVTRNSAAEKAGIKAGDVITKIDDTAVTTAQQIMGALRSPRNKGTVNVTVIRNKKEISISVTLDNGGTYHGELWTPDGAEIQWVIWQGGERTGTTILQ